jgi:DtxR family Mn-dependent transcriptional regulator
MEEYIEVIFELERKNGHAHTTEIAAGLKVKPASVTEMLQKLKDDGYVDHEPYKAVVLTPKGRELARELSDKHETLAEFLMLLGVSKEAAESDACQVEHHVTKETMDRLHKFMDFVSASKGSPKWLEHYQDYLKTGRKHDCKKCIEPKKLASRQSVAKGATKEKEAG